MSLITLVPGLEGSPAVNLVMRHLQVGVRGWSRTEERPPVLHPRNERALWGHAVPLVLQPG